MVRVNERSTRYSRERITEENECRVKNEEKSIYTRDSSSRGEEEERSVRNPFTGALEKEGEESSSSLRVSTRFVPTKKGRNGSTYGGRLNGAKEHLR